MMNQKQNPNKRTLFTFVVLTPIFFVFSLFLSSWFDGHKMDFALYWQAGHMVLAGQNVYDTNQWVAVRNQFGTALHSEPTFQYPLPLAILFTLPSLLPVQVAYTAWLFLGQVMILSSIVILIQFYSERTGYFELLAIAGIFFFRPMFSVFNSGQILPLLILFISLSIRMFHDERWFTGGLLLSILSLKPSIGFPILVISGLWLLVGKRWKGILGMFTGGFVLLAIGTLVNYRWLLDYASIAGSSFLKYFGMHPTLWGAVNKILGRNEIGLVVTALCIVTVVCIQVYSFWRNKSDMGPFSAFASILPAALLIAPYSWNYEQVLLIIPIIFLLIQFTTRYGTGKAMWFMLGVVILAMSLVVVAYFMEHDVWSVITTLVIWLLALYYAPRVRESAAKAVPAV
jgi:hypothetical protein